MSELEDRVTRIESELSHIKADFADTKAEIKADFADTKAEIKSINMINNEFNLKLDRLANSLDNNVKSTEKLTKYMEAQQTKGNIALGKIGWLFVGALISGIVGLLIKML